MRNQRESLRRFEKIHEYSDEENSDEYENRKTSIIEETKGSGGGGADDYLAANLAKLLGNDYKAARDSI